MRSEVLQLCMGVLHLRTASLCLRTEALHVRVPSFHLRIEVLHLRAGFSRPLRGLMFILGLIPGLRSLRSLTRGYHLSPLRGFKGLLAPLIQTANHLREGQEHLED